MRADLELLLSGQLASGMPVPLERTSSVALERFAKAAGAIERVQPKLMHELLDLVTDPLYENTSNTNAAAKGARAAASRGKAAAAGEH